MVNNRGYIIHKIGYKKERRHDYDIYKKNHPITPKEVVTVVNLGYLGVEKDFPEQLSHCLTERKGTKKSYQMMKKSTTKFIPERE